MIRLSDGTLLDVPRPVRHFTRFSPEERANRLSSRRLGRLQRQAVGEFFWTHDLLPGVCYATRKACIDALVRRLGQSAAPGTRAE